MVEQNKWIDRFNSLANIVEQVNSGINFIKDMIAESEDSFSLPQVPSRGEVSEILEKGSTITEDDIVALRAYEILADSFYAYANYLQQYIISEGDLQTEKFIHDSASYVIEILRCIRSILSVMRKAKYGSEYFLECGAIFDFVNVLVCKDNSLSECYPSINFFDDVDKLWEITVSVIDYYNQEQKQDLFSNYIDLYSNELIKIKHSVSDILTDDCPKRIRKKTLKQYAKFMRKTSQIFSKKLTTEIILLYR